MITLLGCMVSTFLFLVLAKAKNLRIKNKELLKVNQVLNENEERFRAITRTAQDGIIIIDNNANIVFWNEAAGKMFEYEEKEIMGKAIDIVVPKRYKKAHKKGFERTKATGEHCVIGNTVELAGLKKSGNEFPLEMSLSEWKTAESVFYTGILRDISDRKIIEKQRDNSISDLQKALSEVKTLQGFLPICSHCKSIRDDKGSWTQIEEYIHKHSDAEFSHGICQKCAEKYYPDLDLYDE
jgi:PAS domain S-box-containing protein